MQSNKFIQQHNKVNDDNIQIDFAVRCNVTSTSTTRTSYLRCQRGCFILGWTGQTSFPPVYNIRCTHIPASYPFLPKYYVLWSERSIHLCQLHHLHLLDLIIIARILNAWLYYWFYLFCIMNTNSLWLFPICVCTCVCMCVQAHTHSCMCLICSRCTFMY